MRVYVKNDVVVATHEDNQGVPPEKYGPEVTVRVVPDNTVLTRVGPSPTPGHIDTRPFKAPTVPDNYQPPLTIEGRLAALEAWRATVEGEPVSAKRSDHESYTPTSPKERQASKKR